MRSRRKSAPASVPPQSDVRASSSASAPSAKVPVKPQARTKVSVAKAANQAHRRGRTAALWIGFLIVIAAGIGLAWIGAGALRPIVTQSGLEFRTLKSGSGEPIARADAALMD